jgi:hypothetical protein
MSLTTWLLEGSYIYGGNKTLNTIFCFYACQFISFTAHSFYHKFVRTQYNELHNYRYIVAYLVSVYIINSSLRI